MLARAAIPLDKSTGIAHEFDPLIATLDLPRVAFLSSWGDPEHADSLRRLHGASGKIQSGGGWPTGGNKLRSLLQTQHEFLSHWSHVKCIVHGHVGVLHNGIDRGIESEKERRNDQPEFHLGQTRHSQYKVRLQLFSGSPTLSQCTFLDLLRRESRPVSTG